MPMLLKTTHYRDLITALIMSTVLCFSVKKAGGIQTGYPVDICRGVDGGLYAVNTPRTCSQLNVRVARKVVPVVGITIPTI